VPSGKGKNKAKSFYEDKGGKGVKVTLRDGFYRENNPGLYPTQTGKFFGGGWGRRHKYLCMETPEK